MQPEQQDDEALAYWRQRAEEAEAKLAQMHLQAQQFQTEIVNLETHTAISALVRGLAHELNNPLAVILGNAERLQRQGDAASQKRAATIIEQVTHWSELVSKLRGLARSRHEPPTAVDMKQAIAAASQRLAQKHFRLPTIRYLSENIPNLVIGEQTCVRVMEQILENALRDNATAVTVDGNISHDRCHIYIENNGRQPHEQEIEHAHKPFFNGRGDGQPGIGLSLCAALLKDYDAAISLESASNGALIHIRGQGSARAADARKRQTGNRILIVDDEELITELLSTTASEEGFIVHTATTATQAHALIDQYDIEAAIIDLRLGNDAGLILIRELLEKKPDLARNFAITTGDPDQQDAIELQRQHDCQILAKPFRIAHARSILRDLQILT